MAKYPEPLPKKNAPKVNHHPFPNFQKNEQKHQGKLLGIYVEVNDPVSIKHFYENGCFGVSSIMTRQAPSLLKSTSNPNKLTKAQYESLIEFQKKFPNNFIECDEEIEIIDKTADTQFVQNIKFKYEDKLVLTLVESFFLHYSLNCLDILNSNNDIMESEIIWNRFCAINDNFPNLFVVYNYYRSKNWVVKNGLKFGSDYLLYKEGPQYYHASFLVFILEDSNSKTNDLQRIYRLAETSGKNLALVEVHKPNCNKNEYFSKIKNFEISEIIPSRFVFNQEREKHDIDEEEFMIS